MQQAESQVYWVIDDETLPFYDFGGGGGSAPPSGFVSPGYDAGEWSILSGEQSMAGITLGVGPANIGFDFGGGSGGGPTISQTLTQIVDGAEGQLQSNLQQFQSGLVDASTAIARGWQILNGCMNALTQYGAEGQKAIAERDRRMNDPRLRWDWISYYIEPIAGGAQGSAGSGGVPTVGGGATIGGAGSGLPYTGPAQAGLGLSSIPDWALILAAVGALLYLSKK